VPDTRNTTAAFFDLYERGDVSEDAIDDFVGAWHEPMPPKAARCRRSWA